jgi:hypothetical protein
MNKEPAFPVLPYKSGMTLRDYFAAKAMQSFLSHLVEEGWDADDLELVAETSYRMADAMMKARKA